MKSRGLKRLVVFVVFLVPVCWYLFLQLFGSNEFSLVRVSGYPSDCKSYNEITILSKNDSLSLVETNYMNRVIFGAEKRAASLVVEEQVFFDCINQSESDLVLVSSRGVYGGYSLSRAGVDQLLTELDILTIQESYGKGTNR